MIVGVLDMIRDSLKEGQPLYVHKVNGAEGVFVVRAGKYRIAYVIDPHSHDVIVIRVAIQDLN
jgi:mRNA-degrading endonuclease RelE of RelBE toxin-antitoxin system